MNHPSKTIFCFSDGAKKGSVEKGEKSIGIGGWGFHYYYLTPKGSRVEFADCGGNPKTTAPEMEVTAFCHALEALPIFPGSTYYLHVDNDYVAKSLVDNGKGMILSIQKRASFSGWLKGWIAKDYKRWVSKTKLEPIKYVPLWKRIVRRIEELVSNGVTIHVQWIPRSENSVADELSNQGVKYVK